MIGPYFNLTERTLVLRADEKNPDRCPLSCSTSAVCMTSVAERYTHDDVLHGTTTPSPPLMWPGPVVGDFIRPHGVDEFIAFLHLLARAYPGRGLHT
ncbi:MAG TPA: hypothetical protein VFD49_06700 [Candidatus Dormibacteraeota bacterium]|nr:hypothetical protein [Candidatus Dormibacteraeota bacterium]